MTFARSAFDSIFFDIVNIYDFIESLMPKQGKTSKPNPKPKRGRPPRGVAMRAFQIRLPAELHKEVKILSAERGESMNYLIEKAVGQLVRRYQR